MAETLTPTSTGDTYEERIAKLEKEKRGILNDLSGEREKRQAYEKRVEDLEKALHSAGEEPEVLDPNAEVNRLAAKPKDYILEVVRPELEALREENRKMRSEKRYDKAYQLLAKLEKKDVDDIYGSEIEAEIARISKERNLVNMDPVDGTKIAYEIYQVERAKKEEEEARRNQTISNNSTQTVRTPSSSGSPVYTRERIAEIMRNGEYEKHRDAILESQRQGNIS